MSGVFFIRLSCCASALVIALASSEASALSPVPVSSAKVVEEFGEGGSIQVGSLCAGLSIDGYDRDGDGRLWALGSIGSDCEQTVIYRFNDNGSIDASFGGGSGAISYALPPASFLTFDTALAVDIQAQRLYIARDEHRPGSAEDDDDRMLQIFALRYDGSLDPAFGVDGIAVLDRELCDSRCTQAPKDIAIDSQGRLVVALYHSVFDAGEPMPTRTFGTQIVRVLPDGSLDLAFGAAGQAVLTRGDNTPTSANIAVQAIALTADDGIVIAAVPVFTEPGSTDSPSASVIHVLNMRPDGLLDATYGDNGRAVIDTGADGEVRLGLKLDADRSKLIALIRAPDDAVTLVNVEVNTEGDGGVVGSQPFQGEMAASLDAPKISLQSNGYLLERDDSRITRRQGAITFIGGGPLPSSTPLPSAAPTSGSGGGALPSMWPLVLVALLRRRVGRAFPLNFRPQQR